MADENLEGAAGTASTQRFSDGAVNYEALGSHSDATRDIGVAVQRMSPGGSFSFGRASSWHGSATEEATASKLAQPGGFRRAFVRKEQQESQQQPSAVHSVHSARQQLLDKSDGTVDPGYGSTVNPQESRTSDAESARSKLGSSYADTNFIDELMIVQRAASDAPEEEPTGLDLRLASPLLPFFRPRSHLEAGVTELRHLVLLILKGFLGSAVLYLPRSFANGGLALASMSLAGVCLLSIICMRQLVDSAEVLLLAKQASSSTGRQQFLEDGFASLGMPSYGDIGEAAFNRRGRLLVEASVAASQIGFCATYFAFVSANLREVLGSLASCRHVPSEPVLCALLLVLWVPLAWIRRLRHFAAMNLVADACILVGLSVILSACSERLLSKSPPFGPLHWAKLDTYPLCLGTAAFAFEGIGLVLPMYEGTNRKLRPHFKATLTWTLIGLCAFFILVAAVAYTSFGPTTRTVILLNLPRGSEARICSQMLFCVALVCTYPLMLHPVSRLLEDKARLLPGQTADGRAAALNEWKRDALRATLVGLTMLVALVSAERLQSLVALVGGLCCAPLAMVYPPILQNFVMGKQLSQFQRSLNVCFAFLGTSLALVSSWQALSTWSEKQALPYFSCTGN